MKSLIKTVCAAFMAAVFVLSQAAVAGAVTDNRILTDPVVNQYIGRANATDTITNINFTDVPQTHYAREAIVRGGALNLIKGGGLQRFVPNGVVSKEEALAFVLRVTGNEQAALTAAATLAATMPAGTPNSTLWSLGYLQIARNQGLITQQNLNDALATEQTELDPAVNFIRTSAVTREQVAQWLYQVVTAADPNAFPVEPIQAALKFTDYSNIDIRYINAVQALAANKIMVGDAARRFNPKAGLTRAEMAVILKNLDSVYFGLIGAQVLSGTVGAVLDDQYTTTGSASLNRNIYIRNADGTVNVLTYQLNRNQSPQTPILDAPTYRLNNIGGMGSIREGDTLTYIVDNNTKQIHYITVTAEMTTTTVRGRLANVNTALNTLSVTDNSGKQYEYSFIAGLAAPDSDNVMQFYMDGKAYPVTSMPYGSTVVLTLNNSIVVGVSYVGEPVVADEVRGIVVENDPNYGFLTIVDNAGVRRNYRYFETDMRVLKQQFYDNQDDIGYYGIMFPQFVYNPRDTVITSVEPGDVVFIRPKAEQADVIDIISASTNYNMRYGRVRQLQQNNGITSILLEYENKQTSWYDMADGIFMTRGGKVVPSTNLMVGDWAKILVNEAVIAPGVILDSVKFVTIEGKEHYISNIVKGNLSNFNSLQKQLVLSNVYSMTKTGWSNYQNIKQYDINTPEIEYYYNNQQISSGYAEQFFKRSDATVYLALDSYFAGERVAKVTFRTERDTPLNADFVTTTNGMGGFEIANAAYGTFATDAGTIVRRYGRLVDGADILPSDYVTVVLNGSGVAAVVDVTEAPASSGVTIARGRLQSVGTNQFKLQSMSALYGMNWTYSPIERVYEIDHNTVFLTGDGALGMNDFVANAAANKVFYIIADGTKAQFVVDSPYATQAVRGNITANDGETLTLNSALYYQSSTGQWRTVSNVNPTITVTPLSNAIIIKNNRVVQLRDLEPGDGIRVMTDTLPTMATGVNVNGVIIFVEK